MRAALVLVAIIGAMLVFAEAAPPKLDLQYHPPPPSPPPPPKKPLNGGVGYGVDHDRGGTNVHVDGRQEVYKNGRVRAEVFGGYDRTFGGPGNGNWNSKVGGRVEYDWGKKG